METATSVIIKKRKALAGKFKLQKRPKKVVSLEIMQDHSNTVEQTYINNNVEQEVTAL